jgi:hypothetical protein
VHRQDFDVLRQPGDRHERLGQIEIAVVRHDRLHDERVDVAAEERGAVRIGCGDKLRSDRAGRPAAILDDDGLAEDFCERLADEARHDVHRPTGRKRHDHPDRPVRKRLRGGWSRDGDGDQSRGADPAECTQSIHVNRL